MTDLLPPEVDEVVDNVITNMLTLIELLHGDAAAEMAFNVIEAAGGDPDRFEEVIAEMRRKNGSV